MAAQLSAAEHRRQIKAYKAELAYYQTYATALERVLKQACRFSVPLAIIHARAKSISSFAEKAIRRHDRYPDAVHDITDLCGARIIVHTQEQVEDVQRFVEQDFCICEKENVKARLGDREFGYLSVHYIVQLKPGGPPGLSQPERSTIRKRKAEIQVRTLLQHAWAEILHDRLYKNKVVVPPELVRTGHLLAALMEEGDRGFGGVATEIDTFFGNYAAYQNRAEIEAEIKTEQTILANEPDESNRPRLAVQLARLLAAGGQDHCQVVEMLQPFAQLTGPERFPLRLELGHALCRVHRASPTDPGYQQGQKYLRDVVNNCQCGHCEGVPGLRLQMALRARALSLLAWSDEPFPHSSVLVRQRYQEALSCEAGNPYYLADVLSFEIRRYQGEEGFKPLRPMVVAAIETCRRHAKARLELPRAWFTRARLHLLLGENDEAFAACARGVQHCLDPEAFAPAGSLEDEIEFIYRINPDRNPPQAHQHILKLLQLAQALQQGNLKGTPAASTNITPPVLIIAGGALHMPRAQVEVARRLLVAALEGFEGTIIAGGTVSGVPGCVGDIAHRLKKAGMKRFRLVAYIPHGLPPNAPKHPGYDAHVETGGKDFSPEELLQYAGEIISVRIKPPEVRLLGFGGGRISAFEYRLALALGAKVAVVPATGGAAEALAGDPDWCDSKNLLLLPNDPTTVRAFVHAAKPFPNAKQLDDLGRQIHEKYVADNAGTPDPSMLPWHKLSDPLKGSNRAQAAYAAQILACAGYDIRPKRSPGKAVLRFAPKEVALMAELEHGRWNVERLGDGWKVARSKDVARKLSPYLLAWDALAPTIRDYDRKAIQEWPEVFGKANSKIVRLPDHDRILARSLELLRQAKCK